MRVNRAQDCLLDQPVGDALGSLVEFHSPEEIRRSYPGGAGELADGGTWNTIAGQPTDDSEMALLLARILTERGAYDPNAALQRVMIDLLADHTESYKQFSDNPSFKKWLGDTIFGVTYQQQAGQ